PKVALGEHGSFVHVIAGNYQGQAGGATTFSPMHLYNAYLQKGDQVPFDFPTNYNTAILIIDGEVQINGETIAAKDQFVLFENNTSKNIELEAVADGAKVLVLSGETLNEPVFHYGPFVMNTEAQIHQAIREFQEGKFG